MKHHHYKTEVKWTGNTGKGTAAYNAYSRDHSISVPGKHQIISASSDPAFLGDNTKYNPEELFLASLSSCHMLWYLHLCAKNGIIITEYIDNAIGVMEETRDGRGRFVGVTLHPVVRIHNKDMTAKAQSLHAEAGTMCFIANSCNFKILYEPLIS